MDQNTLIVILAACVICAASAAISALICAWIWRGLRERDRDLKFLKASIDRLESAAEAEDRHGVGPAAFGTMHEKVNKVSADVASLRGQSEAQYKALSEQLGIIQRALFRPYSGEHRG